MHKRGFYEVGLTISFFLLLTLVVATFGFGLRSFTIVMAYFGCGVLSLISYLYKRFKSKRDAIDAGNVHPDVSDIQMMWVVPLIFALIAIYGKVQSFPTKLSSAKQLEEQSR